MNPVSRPLLLCPTVFVLVFLCGLFYLLNQARFEENKAAMPPVLPSDISSEKLPKEEKLPSLYLPEIFKGTPCPDKSWEISGYVSANFVSARAQLTAWLQNQSWRTSKVIHLGKGLHPKLLLTFEKGGYELIVQLIRHSIDMTSFAYRREKKQTLKKGLLK